jgi:UDP-glucose 4-epimerase
VTRVLVTGALGFVGVNLVRRLATDGADVVALDLHGPSDEAIRFLEPFSDLITHVVADVREAAWDRSLDGARFDLVIHAAAVTPLAPGQEQTQASRTVAVNIGGTARVLDWVANARPCRLVFISSGSVYGSGGGGSELVETTPHDPASVYAISKSASERLALRLGELVGVPTMAVRLTQPYGPMERATTSRSALSPIHDWCEALVVGQPLAVGDLELARDYTHINDVVDAIVLLANLPSPEHRVYNVSSGIDVTLAEILGELRSFAPGLATRPGEPNLSAEMVRPPLSIARLSGETGWTPRYRLSDGLRTYVAWLRDRSRSDHPLGAGGRRGR